MPKIKQGKKLIISLLCLMLAALISFLFVSIFVFKKHNKADAATREELIAMVRQSAIEEGTTWTVEGTGTKEDPFLVETMEEIELSSTLANIFDVNYQLGLSCIKLNADINCGDSSAEISMYSIEIFDGNNHTISNARYNISVNKDKTEFLGTGWYKIEVKAYGLVVVLPEYSTIKNLRVYNCGRANGISGETNLGLFNRYTKVVGGLVGYSKGGTIENCYIDNFVVKAEDGTGNIYAAGVFGVGWANVKNCLVQNSNLMSVGNSFYGIGPHNPTISGSGLDGSSTSWVHVYDVKPSTITSCVITSGSSFGETSVKNSQWASGSSLSEDISYYNHVITNSYIGEIPKDAFGNLGKDIKKPGKSITNQWFYDADSNDGWPCLRRFMTFYKFESSQEGTVTVTNGVDNYVAVPYGKSVTDPKTSPATFYTKVVTATAKAGYNFQYWYKNGTTYTAQYSKEIYKYKFYAVNGVEPEVYVSMEPGVNQGNIELFAYYGDPYTFSISYENGKTIMKYNYNNNRNVIIYKIDGKYTVRNNGLSSMVDSSNKVKVLDENQVYTIIPTVKLKSYEVNYK